MVKPGEKLAESLVLLKKLQDKGLIAIKSNELTRTHRERLVRNGFIREVVKGWYVSVPAGEAQGDSTSWFTSFWEFCSQYLADRYGEDYCISAEQSLMLHSGNNAVPQQLIIKSGRGNNTVTKLLFGTSLFVIKSPLPDLAVIEVRNGIRMVKLPSSLIHSAPSVFTKNPVDARTALMMIRDASELLSILLDGGHSTIAGRLAGAYRNLGRNKMADDILKTMKSAGFDVRETDPFEETVPIKLETREHSPYVNRIKLMWHKMRQVVTETFSEVAVKTDDDIDSVIKKMEDIYITDAYHSLSIERYRVSRELIERVKTGEWNTEENEKDKKHKDTMAARGYWQAFNAVKESIKRIYNGENAGRVAGNDHGDWYRELFAPGVASGLLKASDLAGYRTNQVYIGRSKHTPPNTDAVRDIMPLLFELLEQEQNALVRAVLGHFVFVYIHPYMDGNGRIGRFLMNVMLVTGGYPWTVIPVEEREKYMDALEQAGVDQNIKPFAEFIVDLVNAGLKSKTIAKKAP